MPSTWTLDPDLLDRALAERDIAAVVAVDLYGQCCDYDAIRAVCDRHGAALFQDAAESLGATYQGRPSGGQGDLAAFSFNGNKVITTSGGGALLSDDGARIEHARKLSTQAREPAPHYEHTELGFNYRLSNLLAAVGRAQLEVLPERVAARRRINGRYRELLPDVEFMPEAAYGTSNCWLTCILVDDPRADPPGARGRGHRVAPALEADAPAAVLPRRAGLRRQRVGRSLRARPVPSVGLRADRRRPAADRRDRSVAAG